MVGSVFRSLSVTPCFLLSCSYNFFDVSIHRLKSCGLPQSEYLHTATDNPTRAAGIERTDVVKWLMVVNRYSSSVFSSYPPIGHATVWRLSLDPTGWLVLIGHLGHALQSTSISGLPCPALTGRLGLLAMQASGLMCRIP